MRITDYFQKRKIFKRGPQIITLKDCGMIAAFTGLGNGDIVVDCGAGSGFLSCFLGNIVKPTGKVISYEKREEFAKIANYNIKKAGLEEVVTVKIKNINEGIDEKEVDVITLDMPNPETVVPLAWKALKEGGYIVGYVPTIEQTKNFVFACEDNGFSEIKTIECIVRDILVRKDRGTRPDTKGLWHTGYISFARKIEKEEKIERINQ